MKALFTGIYSKFTGDAELVAALTGGLHNIRAPEGTSYPYAVFSLVSRRPADTLNETLQEAAIQFSIFDDSDNSDDVCDLADDFETLYDEAALTVTGWTVHYCRKILSTMPPPDEEGIYQYVIRYEILMQKS